MTVTPRSADGGNVLEFLSDYTRRLEDVNHAFSEKGIVVSSDVAESTDVLEEDWGITKKPIVWPLQDYKMFYLVNVPPGTEVPAHSHDEDVFRLIVDGSLTINDVPVHAGEWVVVKKGVRYVVKTDSGYTAMSGYTSICRTGRGFRGDGIGGTPPQG